MIGEIQKIDRLKRSRAESYFLRVYFRTGDHAWAQTDLVPEYRNYEHWRDLLVVGNVLGGLKMMTPTKVDGDSRPYLMAQTKQPQYEFPKQASLF